MAIPFGLVGIIIIFKLHMIDLSLVAMIGIIGFAGVVVNDSLIMVDFINRIIKGEVTATGMEDHVTEKEINQENLIKAIITGARYRLRPIALTTITTVAGLIPTAYGLIGGLDSYISPMVMAMAWGLLIGTTATLFVIPIFYIIIFNTSEKLKKVMNHLIIF
jgi:multidrug efflux pump subunit AcrB